jgi:hypothetical protein
MQRLVLFNFIFLTLIVSPGFAADKAELCEPFIDPSKACTLANRPLVEARLDSLKIQCKSELKVTPECTALSASMRPTEREKKLNTCSTQDVCNDKTVAQLMDEGCREAIEAFGKESLEKLQKTWKEMSDSVACNSNLPQKIQMFEAYNRAVPKILQRPLLPEQTLVNMNCSEISRVLNGFADNTQKVLSAKLLAFENKNPAAKNDPSKYPPDLVQYKDWIDTNGKIQSENFSKTIAVMKDLPDQLQKLFRDLGVNLRCYNAKATTELVCAGTAATISMVASTLAGAGATKAALSAGRYLMMLADASGSSKVALAVLAMQKQENMAQKFVAAKRAGDSEAKVNALESSADAAKAKALARATSLSDSERTRAAELLVNDGKTLTVKESEALKAAHMIGKAEGRGYYTYTPADLKKKFQLLQDGGFTKEQANRLLRNGVAGTFTPEEVASAATAIGATISKSPSATVMSYEYQNQLKVKRALKGPNANDAKILIDDTLEKLTIAAKSDSRDMYTKAKAEWLQLKYLNDKGMKDLSVLELKAMKMDLESKFPDVHPRFGLIGETPKELAAERDLLKRVEAEIRGRPEVREQQAAEMQKAVESFQATKVANETSYRTAQQSTAAHPLTTSEISEVKSKIEVLRTNPTSMSPEQVQELNKLSTKLNEKRDWKSEKFSGLTSSDSNLFSEFESARKQAQEKIASKSSSALNLANAQGRTVSPARITLNVPVPGGGTMAKSVQLTRASTDDTQKVMNSLRAVQPSTVSEDFARYKPVVTDRKMLADLEKNLKPLGITRDQLESANVVSMGNPSELKFVSNDYDRARKLLQTLEEAQSKGEVTPVYNNLSDGEKTSLKQLVDVLKFHRDHFVPHHLNNISH